MSVFKQGMFQVLKTCSETGNAAYDICHVLLQISVMKFQVLWPVL